MKKTGERKRKVVRQNRRSDGDQGTGIPKTLKGGKSVNDFAKLVWHLFLF